ncbi:Alpha/beta hydrolase family protein [Bacillus sp. THAF10]|uniref:hypothetical protein n=1 Tax=Bacillus sp. THAF10 TaxID=2587848 RepID=UPI0012689A18|nr:hypothetical protein [Bacillus sp. THAF10]QFT88655.1 Alpha/beta hydrolase family protein [Bacillus sp. THAF10]
MNKWEKIFQNIMEKYSTFIKGSWRYIVFGLCFYLSIYIFFMGFFFYTGAGKYIDVLLTVGVGLLSLTTAVFLSVLVWKFVRGLPKLLFACLIGAVSAIYAVGMYMGPFFRMMGYSVLVLGGFTGITMYFFKKKAKIPFIVTAVCTLALHSIFVYLTATDGERGEWSLERAKETSTISNPAEIGEYAVKQFTYGSGLDKREEYKDVLFKTKTVNLAPYTVQPHGFNKWYREWFWGFNLRQAPVNGRVWMPVGSEDETYPLVLMVHGNHNMVDYSDGGYAYLGEMLASKGYIAVSVDQNFINSGKSGHIGWDNAGRAWLLLKHLEQWKTWNDSKSHELFQKVDMENIALIGHSRGGEAVSTAKLFSELERFPNNAKLRFNFDFNIKSLIGISPGDGRFQPGDQPVDLEDVNYLTIQGGNDTDHTNYWGIRQFKRIQFTEEFDGFKSSIYLYGANHGQFNTSWGMDQPSPYWWFMNREELLDPDVQRDIAKTYISAFLDATLKNQSEYKTLFTKKQAAASFIPTDPLRIQYEDASFDPVANFEEDVDVLTSSSGGDLNGYNLSVWKEMNLLLRNQEKQENQVVKLGWRSNTSRYTLQIPEGISSSFEKDTVLRFDAIQAHKQRYDFYNIPLPEGYENKAIPISVSLKPKGVGDFDSRIRKTMFIDPTYTTKLYRFEWWNKRIGNQYEHMLQTYELPISFLKESFPDIEYQDIEEISFEFNQTESGLILLDNIGFTTQLKDE